ncbi:MULTISPECIES: hypothetical protein [unclassified Bifidobacterium]|uniref:hypothetical protein n=1 Tax=unclassified Bifidobacterium TaxID=2608897 RepID=UPI00112CC1AF|nr:MULTISPECIES: hypothetical protein [unclassified Bifidobacterium]
MTRFKFDAGTVTVGSCLAVFVCLSLVTSMPLLIVGLFLAIPACIWMCMHPVRLIYVQFIYVLFYGFLIGDLHLPGALSYGMDVINAMAFLIALYRFIKTPRYYRPKFGGAFFVLFLFVTVGITSALGNGVNPLYTLWSLRVFLRAPVFLFSAVVLMREQDAVKQLKFLPIYIIFSIPIFLIQKIEFPSTPDNVSGFFGSLSGGNTGLNVLLILVSCLCVVGLLSRSLHFYVSLAGLIICCIFAALSEIKVFYIELFIIILLSVTILKLSFKTLVLIIGFILVFYLGIHLYYILYPDSIDIFDINSIMKYSAQGGYSTRYDLNRLTAVQTLNSDFMHSPIDSLFGFGLGSGQHTQFFEAPLYSKYGDILHWIYFTHASVFIETGFVGLLLYVGFYLCVSCKVFSVRNINRSSISNSCFVFSILSILLISYNSTAIIESSYLMAWFIGLPLVFVKDHLLVEGSIHD